MADQQHLAVLEQGVAAWNEWRRQHPEIRPDLSGADLSEADLSGADLRHANLMRANLSGAYLSEASLNEANLRDADLTEANLREVLLLGADLRQASLRHANLIGAQLNGAKLRTAERTWLETYCHTSPHPSSRVVQAAFQEQFGIQISIGYLNQVRANLGLGSRTQETGKKTRGVPIS